MSLEDVMQEVWLQEVSSGAVLALVAVIQISVLFHFAFTWKLFSTQWTLLSFISWRQKADTIICILYCSMSVVVLRNLRMYTLCLNIIITTFLRS